jgi:LPXTG-motif cell wall-anchored protein
VNVVGLMMAIVIASSPPPTSADWTITPAFGAAMSAPGSAENPELVPGQFSTSGYLITHTDAIDGPLDVSATSTDAPSSFEDHLLVSVAVNGIAGQTQTLGGMLRHSDIARATTALPTGPVILTVKIELDPASTGAERLRSVDFTLFATVSDEVVQLPSTPADPAGSVPPLAATGQVISVAAMVLGGSLTAFGLVLVLRRRRRKPVRDIAQPTA